MKRAFVIASMALVLFLAGCEENPVQEYGTGLVNSYKSSEKQAEAASLATLQRSADAYRAANGRYPADLGVLSAFTGISLDPSVYDYDPATGRLSLR